MGLAGAGLLGDVPDPYAQHVPVFDASGTRAARVLVTSLLVAACGDSPRGWQVVDDSVDGHVLSAWCAGGETLLAGGDGDRGTILRSDGSIWERMPDTGSRTLRWIWGGGAEGAVAVGEGGTVLRLEDGGWTSQFSALGAEVTLWGVWGSDSDDVWAVGGSLEGGPQGVLMHWDSTVWIPDAASGMYDVNFFKVWGCAQDQAWIVGEAGKILRFDGAAWNREAVASDADLYTVHGTPDCGRVWAVGQTDAGRGVLLERSGAGWRVVRDDVPRGLFGVCADDDETWVVGAGGYAGRVTDQGLDEDEAPTDLDLHACFRAPGCGLWAVGGDLLGTGGSPTGIVLHRGSRVPAGPIDPAPADGGASGDGPTGSGDIAPGEECPTGSTDSCQPGLRCWYLMEARRFVCTKDCDDEAFCDAEGFPAGCCARPGSQTTRNVCIPDSFAACP